MNTYLVFSRFLASVYRAVFVLTVTFCFLHVFVLQVSSASAQEASDQDRSAMNEASSFSYADYGSVLAKYVGDDGLVDYAGLKMDRRALDSFIDRLGSVTEKQLRKFSKEETLAFWINAYNAITLQAIIDNYPIKAGFFSSLAFPKNSIRQIKGVWDLRQTKVAGEKRTLDQIEHEILRKKVKDPRIHMALVCAAKSCPILRNEPYLAKVIEKQFYDQALRFHKDPTKFKLDRSKNVVHLSSIFKWFGEDFEEMFGQSALVVDYGNKRGPVLNFVSKHIPESDAAYIKKNKPEIDYLDYDWSLNERK